MFCLQGDGPISGGGGVGGPISGGGWGGGYKRQLTVLTKCEI